MNDLPKAPANADGRSSGFRAVTGSENFLAATITGFNERKGSEMPAEGKGERQPAGAVSGGSAQAPDFSDQMRLRMEFKAPLRDYFQNTKFRNGEDSAPLAK